MNITRHSTGEGASTLSVSWESSGDLLTEETYETIKDVFNGYISLFICILGIPANVVTCLVFWRQGLRDRMNLCLFCLAAVDLLYLTGVVCVGCISAFLHISHSSYAEEFFVKTVMGGVGMVYGLRATSGCYNMIIAVERCVCVVFPLKAASLLHTRTMGVLLAVCFILIQLGYTVIPLQLSVVSLEVEGNVQWRYVPTQLFLDNKDLFQTVEMSVLTVSLPMTTFLVVSVTAVITVIKLTAALKWREKTSSTCKDKVGHQTALTKMILLVSLIYICTMIPSVSLTIPRLVVPEFSPHGRYYYLFIGTQSVANICPLAPSASNALVYYKRSSRFRSLLLAMCRCKQPSVHHASVGRAHPVLVSCVS